MMLSLGTVMLVLVLVLTNEPSEHRSQSVTGFKEITMKYPNIMTYIINPPEDALDEAIDQIADYAEVQSILATLYRTGEISADNRLWLNSKVGDQLRKQFIRDFPNGDIDESKEVEL